MKYKTLLLNFFLLGLVLSVSSQRVYSGTLSDSPSTVEVNDSIIKEFKTGFTKENATINITRVDRERQQFPVFKSYNLTGDVEDLQYIQLTMDMSDLFDKEGVHGGNTRVLSGENLAVSDLDKEGKYYSSFIPHPSDVIYIGSNPDVSNEEILAVNPQKTICGKFLNPNSSFKKVENCENEIPTPGLLENSINFLQEQINKIKTLFLLLALISTLFLLSKHGDKLLKRNQILLEKYHNSSEEKEIADITEKIIHEMESGHIEKDKEILEDLEKANELAYSSKYEKANELLEKAKEELER